MHSTWFDAQSLSFSLALRYTNLQYINLHDSLVSCRDYSLFDIFRCTFVNKNTG